MSLRALLSPKHKKLILAALYSPYCVRDLLFCLWHRLPWRPDWRFYGLPIIQKRGEIIIGRRFTACSDPRHNSMGVFQKVTIKTLSPQSRIEIGDDVGVSGCSISCASGITIGNHVLIGTGVLITDTDAHPIDPDERLAGSGGATKPIRIERNVFIGARAIILKGVTLGEGSVIGAGTVVTRDVPAFSIAAGNPAKVVGDSRRGQVWKQERGV